MPKNNWGQSMLIFATCEPSHELKANLIEGKTKKIMKEISQSQNTER